MALFRLMRPHQWIKNVFVLAGVIFARRLADLPALTDSLLGFGLFCLVSSGIYVLNDLRDREEDRLHPRKCKRPIASGEVSPKTAIGLCAALLLVGLGGSFLLNSRFFAVVGGYFALQLAYNIGLKHAVILDVITIGAGFVLRAISGAVLIAVDISPWMILCTFTLCLFMGFSKRRCELNALNDAANTAADKHRKTLGLYTRDLLNHMTTLTAGVAIVSFMLYTLDQRIHTPFEKQYLIYTIPIVVYAIFRFTLLVEHGLVDGPTDVMLKDRPFQAAILLWVLAACAVVYREPLLKAISD
ncbi:MAG: decaprenyl-phosphate phosphoribosyltransferase [Planctomycetes bacterium]|nr:decaprenyl-phosphate phosphoribosyltransferase [Planctomycetota bacterium]